jgi:hypothetical protein
MHECSDSVLLRRDAAQVRLLQASVIGYQLPFSGITGRLITQAQKLSVIFSQ